MVGGVHRNAMDITIKALVLREVNYKESDKILTVFSQEEGKLTLSARGCRKKGSHMTAACQLLVWGEFTLYQFQGRWCVREAFAQRIFDRVRTHLDKLALASYFIEVADALAEEGQPEPGLLSLTLNCLHALDKLELPMAQVKAAFEWRAISLAGYEPQLGECSRCGKQEPEQPHLHLGEGVLHCAGCRGKLAAGGSIPLTPAALAALRHIIWGERRRMLSFQLDGEGLRRLSKAAEAYLTVKLERDFRTLDFYKGLGPD